MPFISVPIDEAKEQAAVPEGEYSLRIIKAEDKESKKGNAMTQVTIRIEDADVPNARLVNHFLVYPDSATPADQRNMRLLDIARFLQCFGIPHEGAGFNSEDLEGATGRATLTQEEGDDGEIYNRLRMPRLRK